jgi:hexosaminidase
VNGAHWPTIFAVTAALKFLDPADMARAQQPPISVSWQLVSNLPENRFEAALTLTHRGDAPLGDRWALYFNSAARIYPESIGHDFTLTHINGDYFVLRPIAGKPSIPPGQARMIRYQGGPWALNISDAPSGFFFVADDADAERAPVPIRRSIKDFPDAAVLKRGPVDEVPVVTSEARYRTNEALTRLPREELIGVVPTPHEIITTPGTVRIGKSRHIRFEPALAREAEFLTARLEALLGEPIADHGGLASDRDAIRLRIDAIDVDGVAKRPGDEAYLLSAIPGHGIEIVGSDRAGVFYGIQTLLALVPLDAYRNPTAETEISAVRIADVPRFQYRGVHLDVARNFQTKEAVTKLLDLMAFYKLNRLHLHLTDDEGWRIEIRGLPELTDVGGRRGHTRDESNHLIPSHGSGPFADDSASSGNGFYTPDDFIEILRFAHARHITVIPELDFPGHARAAIKAMEARHRRLMDRGEATAAEEFLLREPGDASQYESVQMWRDNVVDVGREATYRFLSLVVRELSGVYQRAGVPLTTIHLGGDEVPAGVWEKSAACVQLPLTTDSNIPRRGQLEIHFLNRASDILTADSIQPACWEDCLMMELGDDAEAGNSRRAAGRPAPTAYVWNNVVGWGREDAAYRLANAGFDVVLCNATHLYFDLACEKDPHEPGYYWAGFVDVRAPFALVPLDVFKNAHRDGMGRPVSAETFANRTRLTNEGTSHIVGIQGQLWAENLRTSAMLEYLAFPRIIALAERAWSSSPAWAEIDDAAERDRRLNDDWNRFANRLGQFELPRLDYLAGGVHYRLPPPGAMVRDGAVEANVELPGLTIRYTIDGSDPGPTSTLYRSPIPLAPTVKLRTFDSRGRGSRTVTIAGPR